ncbi:MAG TPA: glycosyltransferase [Campylobacterales bacterium]|nr:glycosyltransferase [Campylobacterales bacterium]
MNDQPLVSIVMNCYNSDTYLKEAINSVFEQTYQNWEIIFWDNQSTDQSAQIVKSYNDDRVKYFYAPTHTPLGEARNLAIEKVSGEWVAILDCDDIWDKDKLQASFKLLNSYNQKEEVSLLYSKTVYIDENGETFGFFQEHYSGDIHDLLLTKGDFVFISSAIFRTDILNKVGKIDESLHYAEDYDVLLKVTKNQQVLCVDAYHTYYRVHNSSLTSTKVYEYDVENFEFLNNYIKEHNLPLNLKVAIFLNNSSRMTASVIKLLSKKDFINLVKIVKGYWQYLLLSPYYILHFIGKRIRKVIKNNK